jgi:hypothetical protein
MDPLAPLDRTTCKAARALLDWTAGGLAAAAGISSDTLRSFESGRTKSLSRENERAVRTALREAGVQILDAGDAADGPGVARVVAVVVRGAGGVVK